MIGSFISGSFLGLMAVKAFVAMGPGLAGMAMFVDPENTMNIVWAFVGFGIALVGSFIATLILYKDEAPVAQAAAPEADAAPTVPAAAEAETVRPGMLYSPLSGTVVPLNEVKDEVFSTGVLGKGVAVLPDKGELYAPVDGKITMVPDTKHAVSILDASGAEILMHIGMDTVALNGKGFETMVKEGDVVRRGQLLVRFDIDAIRAAGYEVITPVVITNSDDLGVKTLKQGNITAGTDLLKWE